MHFTSMKIVLADDDYFDYISVYNNSGIQASKVVAKFTGIYLNYSLRMLHESSGFNYDTYVQSTRRPEPVLLSWLKIHFFALSAQNLYI